MWSDLLIRSASTFVCWGNFDERVKSSDFAMCGTRLDATKVMLDCSTCKSVCVTGVLSVCTLYNLCVALFLLAPAGMQ